MGNANASDRPADFIRNPKLKLLDQVSEVMRFKHYRAGQPAFYQSGPFGADRDQNLADVFVVWFA